MKDLYEIFGTEANLETEGIWQDFGTTRIKLARSGGKNTTYLKTFKSVMKRYNKVNIDALSDEDQDIIMAEIFAKGVIKAWEIKDEKGKWKSGIILLKDGKKEVVPFNIDSAKQCLLDLPDLFSTLRKSADDIKTYQKEVEEEQLKN